MHALKNGPSIFQLEKGKCNINNYSHNKAPQKKISGLFNSKIKNKASFGLPKKLNAEKINELIKAQPEKEPSKTFQSFILDCVICLDHKVDSFFLPCGHSGSCYSCSTSLLTSTAVCHLCRKVI
jgi:hypothetical protein